MNIHTFSRKKSVGGPSLVVRGILWVLLSAPTLGWCATLYVKTDAIGTNDGTSWANAYQDLPSALKVAQAGDEIWVAKGIHKPTNGTDRDVSFNMKTSVKIYGGFAGNENNREQRNWAANPTILSGDLGTGNKSKHVVIGANGGILDGFTVTGGHASSGGGMLNDNVSPTVRNCTFTTNTTIGSPTASYGGGGMYNRACSPTITNCIFQYNRANSSGFSPGFGGGMYNVSASPRVENCLFASNSAIGGFGNPKGEPGGGGAVYNAGSSSPVFVNCVFTNNKATGGYGWTGFFSPGRGGDGYGGGVYDGDGTSTSLINCTFFENIASGGVGASADVKGFIIHGSPGTGFGGSYYCDGGSPTLMNSILWGNGGVKRRDGANPRFTRCDIQGSGGSGPEWKGSIGTDGGGNIDADPKFVKPVAGDFQLKADSPCIDAGATNASLDVKADINGVQRGLQGVQQLRGDGSGVDIGAHEFIPEPVGVWLPGGGPALIHSGDTLRVAWKLVPPAGTAVLLRLMAHGVPVADFGAFYSPQAEAEETVAVPAWLPTHDSYWIQARSSWNPSLVSTTPIFRIQNPQNEVAPAAWMLYR